MGLTKRDLQCLKNAISQLKTVVDLDPYEKGEKGSFHNTYVRWVDKTRVDLQHLYERLVREINNAKKETARCRKSRP